VPCFDSPFLPLYWIRVSAPNLHRLVHRSGGFTHSVDVCASTLYEAAVLAVASFRRAGLFDVHVGTGTRLRVTVKQPEAVHEVQFGKLQEWLNGGARSPNESLVKARLRAVLAGECNG